MTHRIVTTPLRDGTTLTREEGRLYRYITPFVMYVTSREGALITGCPVQYQLPTFAPPMT